MNKRNECVAWPCKADKDDLGWMGDRPPKRHRQPKTAHLFSVIKDPFSTTKKELKHRDGSVSLSASVQVTVTDTHTLGADLGLNGPSYLIFHPSFGNPYSYQPYSGTGGTITKYNGFVDTAALRDAITGIRMVSSGLRLSATGADAGDATQIWEAIRVPVPDDFFQTFDDTPFEGLVGTGANLSWPDSYSAFNTYDSYSTGHLSNLDDVQFKLNSVNNSHPFKSPLPNTNVVNTSGAQLTDNTYDMIIVRFYGQSPIAIDTEVVSNFEITYDTETPLENTMTTSQPASPNYTLILQDSIEEDAANARHVY